MKLAYTIMYVQDVGATVAFYGRAFGLPVRFAHESGQYAELETGTTALAFAAEVLAGDGAGPFRPTRPGDPPPSMEIAFVVDDVTGAFDRAVRSGCTAVTKPVLKPWGQTVAYVRDCNGYLVELCTAMG